ncbi:MAG: hypothetical protein WCT08_04370 [Patescibacteria group bacterium]|jgi:hypothetical protein
MEERFPSITRDAEEYAGKTSIPEIAEDTAKMIEGNEALADRTRKDMDRGEGYRKMQKEAADAVNQYEGAVKEKRLYVDALREKVEKSTAGHLSENDPKFQRLRDQLSKAQKELNQMEEDIVSLRVKQDFDKSHYDSLKKEQEFAANLPEEHAINTVMESKGISNPDKADHVRRTVPGTLNRREQEREDAIQEKKEAENFTQDMEILYAIQAEFTALKDEDERVFAEAITKAQSPEVHTQMKGLNSQIKKLEKAWFGKTEKHAEAEKLKGQLKAMVNDIVFLARDRRNAILEFDDRNTGDRLYPDSIDKPSLKNILLSLNYRSNSPRRKQLEAPINQLTKEIDAYWKAIHPRIEQVVKEIFESLNLEENE